MLASTTQFQRAHWTEGGEEHCKELAAALRWTGCNTLSSDIKQFALLCEQNVEALWRREPKFLDSSCPFYACCDGLSVFNGKLLQAQKCLGFPAWFLASQNYFRQKWRLKTVKHSASHEVLLDSLYSSTPGPKIEELHHAD
eukprot:g22657.t1